jgi:hypothetical protein
MRVFMNDESTVLLNEDYVRKHYPESMEVLLLHHDEPDLADVELDCTAPDCTSGVAGACWKTQKLPAAVAVAMLQLHHGDVHGQRQAGGGDHRGDGGGRNRPERLTRPTISAGSNQHDFKLFIEQWNQYKEFSGETDADILRDQLMSCPDRILWIHMNKSLGDKADTITEADLLKEIEMLVVKRPSNQINTVALMSATRERDEGIRQFAARLKGLAAVCEVTVTGHYERKRREAVVESSVYRALVKKLSDKDTQQEVMSQVKDMTLDETITFLEARETGEKSKNILCGGGMDSGQVHKVKSTNKGNEMEGKDDNKKCKFCGTKGHGKSPNINLKKASCPAFDNNCEQCMRRGHFQDFCPRKPSEDIPESDGGKNKADSQSVMLSRVQFSKGMESTKKWEISKSDVKLLKKVQNMTKLGHEWSAEFQTCVETDVPKDPVDAGDKVVEVETLPNTKVCLECDECHFRTAELKMSKAKQRLASHLLSHARETPDNDLWVENGPGYDMEVRQLHKTYQSLTGPGRTRVPELFRAPWWSWTPKSTLKWQLCTWSQGGMTVR